MKYSKKSTKTSLIAASLALALSAFCSAGNAANDEQLYYIYGDAPTGTRIEPRILTSKTPLEATYEQLSEADKVRIKADYANMPADDEPPFPQAGLMPIWEAIVTTRHPSDQVGDVVAIASVNPKGKVEKVAMYNTTSNHMSRLVSTALLASQFKPAICAGNPCAMDYILEARLDIELMRN